MSDFAFKKTVLKHNKFLAFIFVMVYNILCMQKLPLTKGRKYKLLSLLEKAPEMQNIYAPLPLSAHLVFCVLSTLLYAVLFNRRGKKHYLILMIAIDLTLMTQFWTDKMVIFALGIAEAILIIMTIVLTVKENKEEKEAEEIRLAKERIVRREQEEKKKSEKLFINEEYIDKNFVDNAFDEDEE